MDRIAMSKSARSDGSAPVGVDCTRRFRLLAALVPTTSGTPEGLEPDCAFQESRHLVAHGPCQR
eukprot:7722667-Pyramimonas_sp.AAC.1